MPSCNKNNGVVPSSRPDSLMFGYYNSFSATPILSGQFYMLKKDSLFASPTAYFQPYGYFSEHALPDSLYQIARYLTDNFPLYLQQHAEDSSIGCPGCADGNIMVFCAFSNGISTRWEINPDTATLPMELKQYIWRAGIIVNQL